MFSIEKKRCSLRSQHLLIETFSLIFNHCDSTHQMQFFRENRKSWWNAFG